MRSYVDLGRSLLRLFGYLLIGLGAACLLYLAIIVFQIINSPEQVRLVEFILQYIPSGDRAAYGQIGQQTFELNLGQSVRTVLFLLIGAGILSIIASIAKTLVSSGIELLHMAGNRAPAQDREERKRGTVNWDEGGR